MQISSFLLKKTCLLEFPRIGKGNTTGILITVAVECHPHGLASSSTTPGITKETLKLKKATVGQLLFYLKSHCIIQGTDD